MTRSCLFGLFAVVLLAGPVAAKPAELPLAADGKALVPVVVSDKASPATKQVASELADYLGRITGAKFEVVAGDGTKGIVLGTLAEFPNPALAAPLAIRDTFDGREAFAIRTEPTRVLLLGATDLGGLARRVPLPRIAGVPLVLPGEGVGGDPLAKGPHRVGRGDGPAEDSRPPHLVRLRVFR